MPRASWKGFLRLSLVSCPVYLSPATTRTKAMRLHHVWAPRTEPDEPVYPDAEDERPAWPAEVPEQRIRWLPRRCKTTSAVSTTLNATDDLRAASN